MGFFFPLIITSLLASLAATSPFQLEPDRLHLNLSSVSSGSYDSNQTALVDQNVTVSSSKNGNPIIVCDGQKYRHDLNLKSCEDAVSRVGSDRRNTIFGVRGGKMVDVGLPQRFISGDGLCTIDVVLKADVERAAATYQQLTRAATSVLNSCVRPNHFGGLAMDIGDARDLGLFMTSYKPFVVCQDDEKAPPRLNCARLLGSMMTSKGWLNFGITPFPRDWVPLPKPLREAGARCRFTIRTLGGNDISSWSLMWEAMVAINGMCARFGKTGTALHLGRNKQLFIDMEPDNRPGVSES